MVLVVPWKVCGQLGGAETGGPWWAGWVGGELPSDLVAQGPSRSLSTPAPSARPWTAALPGNLSALLALASPLLVSQLLRATARHLASKAPRLQLRT